LASCSEEPLKSLSRRLQPPQATTSPSFSSTKYVPSVTSIVSTWAMWTIDDAVWRAS
jgi:hypothetical protein